MKTILFLTAVNLGICMLSTAHGSMSSSLTSDAVWEFRIINHDRMAKYKTIADLAVWCSEESKKENGNDEPCYRLSNDALKAEQGILGSRRILASMIESIKKAAGDSELKQHLPALEQQLSEMNSMPTPFHDIYEKSKSKNQ